MRSPSLLAPDRMDTAWFGLAEFQISAYTTKVNKPMSALSYTNAQFRSILNGLGLRNQGQNEPNFPISDDDGNLGDFQE